MDRVRLMDRNQQLSFAGQLFSAVAEDEQVFVPKDFLPLSLNAMKHLQSNGRSNVVYGLSKMVGTLREDGSDSLLPSKTVIMG